MLDDKDIMKKYEKEY